MVPVTVRVARLMTLSVPLPSPAYSFVEPISTSPFGPDDELEPVLPENGLPIEAQLDVGVLNDGLPPAGPIVLSYVLLFASKTSTPQFVLSAR